MIPLAPLFPDEGEAALAVFKSLVVVDVVGKPTFGQCCDEWVFDFVRLIFGAYDNVSAKRLITEFFLLISKKNGKSTLAAGIMVTALVRNWRYSNELYILAPTLEVANNAFGPAAEMVRADPQLLTLLHVKDNLREIKHRVTKAFLKVVAADTDTVSGKKSGFVLVDELWLFGKRPQAKAMLMEALGGLVTRPEGFVIFLSTQSDEDPAGVFKEKLDLYRDIRDGKIVDPKKFGVLFEFPKAYIEAESYLDPANFYITNPNVGRSVQLEWLIEKLGEALRGEKRDRNIWLAKHLNIEIGNNLRANRWPGAEFWATAVDDELSAIYANAPFDALYRMLDRVECAVVGWDGGGLDDLAGLNVLGREPDEIEVEFEIFGKVVKQRMKRWLSWSHAWCHDSVFERRKSIAVKLREFEAAGELTVVDNDLADIASAVEVVRLVKDRGLLGGVAVDPAGLSEFAEALEAPDIDVTVENKLLIGAPQGFGMMNAIKTMERRLAKRMLLHCGGKLMPWCVSNLKIERTATAIHATKQNAGDLKIDPAMAMFDSGTLMSTNPGAFRKKKYQVLFA